MDAQEERADCPNLALIYEGKTMFAIIFGFVVPGVFGDAGLEKWLVWLFGLNLGWDRSHKVGWLWVRVCGFSIVLELNSPKNYAKNGEKLREIAVTETVFTKKGKKSSRKVEDNDQNPTRAGAKEWLVEMINIGYKYVITSDDVYDAKDRSFRLPKDEGIDIEIGNMIAFGTQVNWVGVTVVGFREEENEIIYYVEPVRGEITT